MGAGIAATFGTIVSSSVLEALGTVRALRVPDALGIVSARGACCGSDWQSSIPRLTPVERRSDLALGCCGGGGSAGGEDALRVFSLTGCTARSTLLMRLEALTGGEDVGAARLGVSIALTFGTGTLPRGIFGVCNCGGFGTMALMGGLGGHGGGT